jgi:cGMP-dependent protein kinase
MGCTGSTSVDDLKVGSQHKCNAGTLLDAVSRHDGNSIVKSVEVALPPVVPHIRMRDEIFRRDLTKKGILGCGGFGLVELVEHNWTHETFALKAMSKGYVVMKQFQREVTNEKNIQMMCDSPFIIKLYETYSDYENLYLLLELSLGGEVAFVFHNQALFGSKRHAQFAVASCVYALDHMHERQIVFRDLKPQNMLIAETGHVKLTDFGFSKVFSGRTFTLCGTAEYVAPEVIDHQASGYGHAVDWWSLGITTFELMTGQMPFKATQQGLRRNSRTINADIDKVAFPEEIQGSCEDFVKKLLKIDPCERLPMRNGGINNIQTHMWFKEFEWEAMLSMTLEPPYKPCIESKTDVTHFHPCKEEEVPPQLPFKDYDDGSFWYATFATSK